MHIWFLIFSYFIIQNYAFANCQEIIKELQTKYAIIELQAEYVGEIKRGSIGADLRYLDKDDRINYEIFVKEGRLFDHEGNPLQGYYNYVMDQNGVIYADLNANFSLHHSCFLAGGPVAAAGSMRIKKGKLLEIDNSSGHYKPIFKYLMQIKSELESRGIDFTQTKVINISPTINFVN